jgi:propionyl-CoA carboxylase alpha chain
VYLGERECSIQRRYQKIIEEAPSTVLTETLRRRMGQAACALAAAAGYVNAGTVEFILDPEGRFYFLEVNTRLQVEHPVTEMVTGLDLVELQLAIAAGQPLPIGQEQVQLKGWSIEARICAENPARGFLPATGMITRYAEPQGENIRVDSGIQTGTYVGVYYDSLLAKIICRGADREEARVRLVEALNGYHVEGVTTNLDFANAIVCHPEFVSGNLYTGFIDDHFTGDRPNTPPEPETLNLAASAATLVYHVRTAAVRESLRPMAPQIGAVPAPPARHHYMVRSEQDLFDIHLNGRAGDRHWQVSVNGSPYHVLTPEFEFYRRRLKLTVNGRIHRFRLHFDQSFVQVAFCGVCRRMEIYTPKEWALMKHMPAPKEKAAENALVCPMPGLVVAVRAKTGERVYRGQDLVILESMKMESGVASPSDGVVADILVETGKSVEAGDLLIRFVENDRADGG